MTQRIEPCVKRKDSKSGTFFYSEVKNCFFSFSLNFFFWKNKWLKEHTIFFWLFFRQKKDDSKNCFFFNTQRITHWIDWTDFSLTQRIEFFVRLSELNPFFVWIFKYDAKNWTSFSLNMTLRIEPFFFE